MTLDLTVGLDGTALFDPAPFLMKPHLTVAYMTNRKEPCLQWFLESFHNECKGNYDGIKLVVIDYWAQAVDSWTDMDVIERLKAFSKDAPFPFLHIPPKPTVWQGKHRLAKINYFAAANARNTALCVAPDGYIAFVDDLAVLLPGWLDQLCDITIHNQVAMGAYSKVLNLQVEKGKVVNYQFHPHGRDGRLDHVHGEEPVKATGSWHFGCSLAIPVESLLQINGFDEDCDSMGFEDVICGIMLERSGCALMYCPRMRTLESEERHFIEVPFARIIKKMRPPSQYPDSSHAILDWTLKGRRVSAPNYQNMRETRSKVLAGEPFPFIQCPQNDWRDGQLICEMNQTR